MALGAGLLEVLPCNRWHVFASSWTFTVCIYASQRLLRVFQPRKTHTHTPQKEIAGIQATGGASRAISVFNQAGKIPAKTGRRNRSQKPGVGPP